MNGQRTLRISNPPEELNHCIRELIFLIFVSTILNESPLWSLLVLEEFLVFFDEDFHPFTSSFIISTRLLLLHLGIKISSSSLLLDLIQCGWSESEFELEVLIIAQLL